MRKDSVTDVMDDLSESIRGWHNPRVRDFEILADAFDLIWVGDELPSCSQGKTLWWCKHCGDSFKASYPQVRDQRGCGVRHEGTTIPPALTDLAAQVQRLVQPTRITYFQSYCGLFSDLSITYNGVQLIIFQDTPKYNAKPDQQAQDNYRTQILVATGFRVLRIRSAVLLPSDEELAPVLAALTAAKESCIMTLTDWTGVEWKPTLI